MLSTHNAQYCDHILLKKICKFIFFEMLLTLAVGGGITVTDSHSRLNLPKYISDMIILTSK